MWEILTHFNELKSLLFRLFKIKLIHETFVHRECFTLAQSPVHVVNDQVGRVHRQLRFFRILWIMDFTKPRSAGERRSRDRESHNRGFAALPLIAASPLSALVDRAAFFVFNSKRETARSLKRHKFLKVLQKYNAEVNRSLHYRTYATFNDN